MNVQLKSIVLAVPALSKVTTGDLSLRLAYNLKQMVSELQKKLIFLLNSVRKFLRSMVQQKMMVLINSKVKVSRKRMLHLENYWRWK